MSTNESRLTFAGVLLGKVVGNVGHYGGQLPLVLLHAGHLLLVEVWPPGLGQDYLQTIDDDDDDADSIDNDDESDHYDFGLILLIIVKCFFL
jgi:hypothetical protein